MEATLHTQCEPAIRRLFLLEAHREEYASQEKNFKKKLQSLFDKRTRDFQVLTNKFSLDYHYTTPFMFHKATFDNTLGLTTEVGKDRLYEVPILEENKQYFSSTTLTPPISDTLYITESDKERTFDLLLECSPPEEDGEPIYLTPLQYLNRLKKTIHRLEYALITRNKQIKDEISTKSADKKEALKDTITSLIEGDRPVNNYVNTNTIYDAQKMGILFAGIYHLMASS